MSETGQSLEFLRRLVDRWVLSTVRDEALAAIAQLEDRITHGPVLSTQKPIPMRLVCEGCGQLHIDEGEFATKPHHTHSCQHCGMTWRPAVVSTVGVRFLPGFKNASPAAPPEILIAEGDKIKTVTPKGVPVTGELAGELAKMQSVTLTEGVPKIVPLAGDYQLTATIHRVTTSQGIESQAHDQVTSEGVGSQAAARLQGPQGPQGPIISKNFILPRGFANSWARTKRDGVTVKIVGVAVSGLYKCLRLHPPLHSPGWMEAWCKEDELCPWSPHLLERVRVLSLTELGEVTAQTNEKATVRLDGEGIRNIHVPVTDLEPTSIQAPSPTDRSSWVRTAIQRPPENIRVLGAYVSGGGIRTVIVKHRLNTSLERRFECDDGNRFGEDVIVLWQPLPLPSEAEMAAP